MGLQNSAEKKDAPGALWNYIFPNQNNLETKGKNRRLFYMFEMWIDAHISINERVTQVYFENSYFIFSIEVVPVGF